MSLLSTEPGLEVQGGDAPFAAHYLYMKERLPVGSIAAPWDEPELKARIRNGEFASPLVKKWRGDIQTIGQDLFGLKLSRQVFNKLLFVFRANPKLAAGSTFFMQVSRWYAHHVLVAIRRDVDPDTNVVSLSRLLGEISRDAGELTRGRYRRLHTGSPHAPAPPNEIFLPLIDSGFDEFADQTKQSLDANKIEADIERLSAVTNQLNNLTNTHITHRERLSDDERARGYTFNPQELDAALDVFGEIVKKYTKLLTGVELLRTEPIDQTNWEQIFAFAWRPQSD